MSSKTESVTNENVNTTWRRVFVNDKLVNNTGLSGDRSVRLYHLSQPIMYFHLIVKYFPIIRRRARVRFSLSAKNIVLRSRNAIPVDCSKRFDDIY